MIFPDYNKTNLVYHVASITELSKILKQGIKYDDKSTYTSKYSKFHKYLDDYKPDEIPKWVIRQNAIFASFNYQKDHTWHSHSAVLGIKVNPERCWYANENLANKIYEPFILKEVEGFESAKNYLDKFGSKIIKEYWNNSMSFYNGLKYEYIKDVNYDSEILVFHEIEPEDIQIMAIVSDHRFMKPENWKKHFIEGGNTIGYREVTK